MDVVRTNLEQIGGVVEIDSSAGQGSVFTLRLPLTLAIMPCLLLSLEGHCYGVPQRDVEEILLLECRQQGFEPAPGTLIQNFFRSDRLAQFAGVRLQLLRRIGKQGGQGPKRHFHVEAFKFGRLGESGKCCVSRQKPACLA